VAVERIAVDQHDRLAGAVVFVVNLDVPGVAAAWLTLRVIRPRLPAPAALPVSPAARPRSTHPPEDA